MNLPHSLQWGRDQMIAELPRKGVAVTVRSSLQWGRDQMIAELTFLGFDCAKYIKLQWGRDQMIAELSVGLGHYRRDAGFNGAAIK